MLSRRGHLDRDALVTDRERKSGYCALTKRSALQMGASGGTMKVASVVKRITFLIMTMALAVAMVACQGAVGKPGEPGEPGDAGTPGTPGVTPNLQPLETPKLPTPVTGLAEDSEAKTIVVSDHFHDPEGEALTYAVAVTPEGIVTAELADNEAGDSLLTITPSARGYAIITVTATDPGGMFKSADIEVTVAAEGMKPPVYGGSLPGSIPLLVGTVHTIQGADIVLSFVEPEDESLTYDSSVNDNSIVSLIKGADGSVTIEAVAVGDATVTITATDEDDLTATYEIEVTVVGSAEPVTVGEIEPQSPNVGDAADVDVSRYFRDPLGGDLEYTAESSDSSVATAAVAGSVVTITPVGSGEATVTITATNSRGLLAKQPITVTVTAPDPKIPDQPKSIRDFEPVSFAYYDPVVYTFELSDYFMGATSYTVESDNEAVAIPTEDEGVLSITPGRDRDGRANVTVTAINDGGSSPQKNIVVDVLPKPNMKPTVKDEFKDVRLVEYKGSEPTPSASKWVVTDLNDYFTDPENLPLTFKVVIASETPAAGVVIITTKPSGFGKAAQVDATAVGTATIKVTAIDNVGKTKDQTFEITVVKLNNFPTVDSDSDAVKLAQAGYAVKKRLKLSDSSKKPINDKKVGSYFKDDDLGAAANSDRLTFTAKYVVTGGGTIKGGVLSVNEKDKIKDGDAVATAEISPNTWDGGANDKFTVTVTPKKAGDAHDILIVATDLGGRQAVIRIPVQVNRPPVAVGAQTKDPKKLSEFKDAEKLRGSAAAIILKLDDPILGYFHDDDGDKLTCSAAPDVTGDTAPAVVTMKNNELNLKIKGYDANFVSMEVTVFCTDEYKEESPRQTFTVAVISVGN